jgi:hypothetical protein
MEVLVTVEFVAEAPGDFVAELQVVSELNVATLVCSAKVEAAAEAAEAASEQAMELGQAGGSSNSAGGQ